MCNGFGQKDESFAKKVKQLRKITSYNIEKKAWRENEKVSCAIQRNSMHIKQCVDKASSMNTTEAPSNCYPYFDH